MCPIDASLKRHWPRTRVRNATPVAVGWQGLARGRAAQNRANRAHARMERSGRARRGLTRRHRKGVWHGKGPGVTPAPIASGACWAIPPASAGDAERASARPWDGPCRHLSTNDVRATRDRRRLAAVCRAGSQACRCRVTTIKRGFPSPSVVSPFIAVPWVEPWSFAKRLRQHGVAARIADRNCATPNRDCRASILPNRRSHHWCLHWR